MKFMHIKPNGEKLYVEAIEHKDLDYYRDSPRWETCSDEEWEKAMNPAESIQEAEEIIDMPEDIKVEQPVIEDEITVLDVEEE